MWDGGMTYPAKMQLVREKLCATFAVYLDKDPELVTAEVTPADFGPTLDPQHLVHYKKGALVLIIRKILTTNMYC